MFSLPPTRVAALHADLQRLMDHDMVCHRYTTNHGSMTLTALHALSTFFAATESDDNADKRAAVDAAIEHYKTVTLPDLLARPVPVYGTAVDPETRVSSDDEVWLFLGRRDAISGIARYLFADLEASLSALAAETRDARRTVFGAWLCKWLGHPHVRRGVGCAAAHGILRIAFGLEADFAADVAFGVATVITNHFPTPAPAADTPFVTDVERSLDRAMLDQSLRHYNFVDRPANAAKVGGIDGRCAAFFVAPAFAAVLPRLDGSQPRLVLRNMLALAVRTFRSFHDFSALHIFSGSVAMEGIVTVMEGHASSEVIGDLLSGFWAEGLAIAMQLPHNAKTRADAAAAAAATSDSSSAAVSSTDLPMADASSSQEVPPPVEEVAAGAVILARERQEALGSTDFEHLVKLAFATVFATRWHRADETSSGEWRADFERNCAIVVAREMSAPSPF